MSSSVSGHLTACQALAKRFSDATGGHAKAGLDLLVDGGVSLTYFQGCPLAGSPAYQAVHQETMSLMRVMDSLTLHVARALAANAEGLELAAVSLESTTASTGRVHLQFFCPAWHQPYSLPCWYRVQDIDAGKHVTIELIGPTLLTTEQGAGWERMYEAGLVGHLARVLPLASQAIAQLMLVNDYFGICARTVLLPGEHRQYSGFKEKGIVLRDFESGTMGYWNVYPKGNTLQLETAEGSLELSSAQKWELTGAVARWQTIAEAVCDAASEDGPSPCPAAC